MGGGGRALASTFKPVSDLTSLFEEVTLQGTGVVPEKRDPRQLSPERASETGFSDLRLSHRDWGEAAERLSR